MHAAHSHGRGQEALPSEKHHLLPSSHTPSTSLLQGLPTTLISSQVGCRYPSGYARWFDRQNLLIFNYYLLKNLFFSCYDVHNICTLIQIRIVHNKRIYIYIGEMHVELHMCLLLRHVIWRLPSETMVPASDVCPVTLWPASHPSSWSAGLTQQELSSENSPGLQG